MNCKKVKTFLSDYLDNELSEHMKQEIDAHLKSCRKCSSELSLLKKVIHELDSIEKVNAPDDLLMKLHKQLEKERHHRGILPFVRQRKNQLRILAVAASVLLTVYVVYQIQEIRLKNTDHVYVSVGDHNEGTGEIKIAHKIQEAPKSVARVIQPEEKSQKLEPKSQTTPKDIVSTKSEKPFETVKHDHGKTIELGLIVYCKPQSPKVVDSLGTVKIHFTKILKENGEVEYQYTPDGKMDTKLFNALDYVMGIVSQVQKIVETNNGTIDSLEPGPPIYVLASIPVQSLDGFLLKIERIGKTQKILPPEFSSSNLQDIDMDKDKYVQVKIVLTHSP